MEQEEAPSPAAEDPGRSRCGLGYLSLRDDMGEVEVFENEQGALKVVHHYDLRAALRRMRAEGLERHRVSEPSNCCWGGSSRARVDETTFTRRLKIHFQIILGAAVVFLITMDQMLTRGKPPNENVVRAFIADQIWIFQYFGMGQRCVVFVVMIAVILTIGVLVINVPRRKKKKKKKRRKVQTVSGRIQHI